MALLMVTTVLVLASLSIFYYIFVYRRQNYWKNKNVPYLKPTPILGNYGDYILLKKTYGQVVQRLCQAFPKEPYVGAYFGTEPTLIAKDPELIKIITTKDFQFFSAREIQKHVHKEHFGYTLFSSGGDRWKVLRQNMTPLFTSSKMKNMFHLIEKRSHVFEDMLDREFKITDVQEVRSIMARFTMDCICACSFGVDTNTMSEQAKDNAFVRIGNEIFKISALRGYITVAKSIWPSIFYGLGLRAFPKAVSDFFYELVIGVFKSRNYKPSSRNDFVDLILSWRNKSYITAEVYGSEKLDESQKISLKVDDELLVAQCMVFFGAGFETSATTLGWTLYELAKDQAAQDRALEDVDAYMRRHDNKLIYDCLTELPFLEACINEALRMYPVLGVITREVSEDYTLPTGVCLEKGLRIHLPVHYLHRNPEHFPEPDKFRPERFLPENRHEIKPCTYIPFGDGPRQCIGMRFAKMQTMSGLITLLKKYRVELAKGMPRDVEWDPRALVTLSKVGINLRLVEREGWEQRLFDRNSTAS